MVSVITDRIRGADTSLALKAPCRAATTANITLSGEQTIDGVAVVADDRVLVKNQTTASENGIYIAATGAWERAPDFDGARDVVQGTQVRVSAGTIAAGLSYYISTANPITIGTTSISFSVALFESSASAVAAAASEAAAEAAQAAAEAAQTAAEDALAQVAVLQANPFGGVVFNYASSTSMADPSTGNYRLNNATLASVTGMAISKFDASGNDVRPYILQWDDSNSTIKGTIILRDTDDSSKYAVFNIDNASTDNTTWLQLSLAYVIGSGTFTAGEPFTISFARTGNRGTDGAGSGDLQASQHLSEIAALGGTAQSNSRTNLGLGSIATQAASSVSITGGSITGITDLAVADGGTGRSTLTANGVLVGNGTSGINATAVGSAGQVLTSNGAGSDPTFQTPSTGGPTGGSATSSAASVALTNSSDSVKEYTLTSQGQRVVLPDATTITSEGPSKFFIKSGAASYPFHVADTSGNVVKAFGESLATNEAVTKSYFNLLDNSTSAGSWVTDNDKVGVVGIGNTHGDTISNRKVCPLSASLNLAVYVDSTTNDDLYAKAFTNSLTDGTFSYGAAVAVDMQTAATNRALETYNVRRIDDTRALIVWRDYDSTNMQGVVASISGTTVTLGTPATIHASAASPEQMMLIDTDKILISFREVSASTTSGKMIVLTFSGTTITVGTADGLTGAASGAWYVNFDIISTTAVLTAWYESGSNPKYAVASISGTTITFGTPATTSIAYTAGQIPIIVTSSTTALALINYGTLLYCYPITISGTSVTIGTPQTVWQNATTAQSSYGQLIKLYDGSFIALVAKEGSAGINIFRFVPHRTGIISYEELTTITTVISFDPVQPNAFVAFDTVSHSGEYKGMVAFSYNSILSNYDDDYKIWIG